MASIDITRIAGNIGALNTLNSLESINKQLATHQARLASGKRINSAADDPAGLSIATKLNVRSQGLTTALSNIGDAQSMLSVAESGMSKINDILTQMRNKAQQGASDTMGSDERSALVNQMQAYSLQIQDAVDQTKWNGKKLLDGLQDAAFGGAKDKAGSITFQTGANSGDNTILSGLSDLEIGAGDPKLAGLGLATVTGSTAALTLSKVVVGNHVPDDKVLDKDSNAAAFSQFMTDIEGAQTKVTDTLATIGSMEGRMSFKSDQLTDDQANVEGAYNRIMNADMASEQVQASKLTILQQTSTAMLAQANSAPQFILSLFR